MKNLNDYIAVYKALLAEGDIQKAYSGLIKYVLSLKPRLSEKMSNGFSFGNISRGYMDYTYFPFFNDFLRTEKLRFGIVLNHEKVRFELWLMGQNAGIQRKYWNILKTSIWNKNQMEMPRYSVLEVILVENPDFNNTDALTQKIIKDTTCITEEIITYLKNNKY